MDELPHVAAVHLELLCDAADGRALPVEFFDFGEAVKAFGAPFIASALLALTHGRR